MAKEKPIVGAALTLPYLETYRKWLLEKPRDLELQDFISPKVLEGDWAGLVEEIKPLLDGLEGRIGIHGPFVGFSLSTPDRDVQNIVKRRLEQGLQICEALGGTHMVIHSPYTIWNYNNLDNRIGAREGLIENCHATMKEAVKRAEDIGCTIVVENIEDIDPYARGELVESFNSEALAISIDTGHAHFMHKSFNAPPVDYFVKAAGKKLAHVHIQDVDGYADRHWVPGQGSIAWHAVFAAMENFSGNPRLIIEMANLATVGEAAEWLVGQGLVR